MALSRACPGGLRILVVIPVTIVLVFAYRASTGVTEALNRRRLGSGPGSNPGEKTLETFEEVDETPSLRLSHARVRVERIEEIDYDARNAGQGDAAPAADGLPSATASRQKQRAELERILRPLRLYPGLNVSNPATRQYARIVDDYMGPWKPIPGSKSLGKGRGQISPHTLKYMSTASHFLSCCGHVRIVRGRVYFRYGGFLQYWYRVRRFVLTLKTIQLAIKRFEMQGLTAEFFLNTCDQPISFDSAIALQRGGYPVFSIEWWTGSTDLLYPDPLDLEAGYMSKPSEAKIPWAKRQSKAVFRGGSTNFKMYPTYNWRASPRFRLHVLAETRPDLMDAHISRWTNAESTTIKLILEDGVQLAPSLDREEFNKFKYELVVDGGGGTSRTCGALQSGRLMIKQDSVYQQFMQPMLQPYINFVPTEHHFDDLVEQLEWVRQHDDAVQAMVARAQAMAERACTWDGRALYWAVMLAKYAEEALEDKLQVQEPETTCKHVFPEKLMFPRDTAAGSKASIPPGWPHPCRDFEKRQQPECSAFCIGPMQQIPAAWVTLESLEHIQLQ